MYLGSAYLLLSIADFLLTSYVELSEAQSMREEHSAIHDGA